MICVCWTSLDGGNHCLLSLDCYLDHECIWVLLSSIVTRRLKNPRGSCQIGPKWFVKQALDHASEQHWDILGTLWLTAFSCLKFCSSSFSGYRQGLINLFSCLVDIPHFWNCHLRWSPRTFFVCSAQMSCSKPSNPILDCGVGRALMT
jgi:hypothetical protein